MYWLHSLHWLPAGPLPLLRVVCHIKGCTRISQTESPVTVTGTVTGGRHHKYYAIHSSLSLYNPFKAQWLIYIRPGLTFTNSTFCPQSIFMCFVWISKQTAIISLYSINWLVFCNRDGVCLLRGTDWIFIYNSGYVFCMDLRTNSDYFPIQHWLTGFYNPDGVFTARYGLDLYI
jgi:hypothetical protein